MKTVYLTADDYGCHPAVDAAVLDLIDAGRPPEVEVVEDKKRGLVARLSPQGDTAAVQAVLGQFTQAWEWQAKA